MTKEIELTRGKVTRVDDSDFERVRRFKWHAFWNGSKEFPEPGFKPMSKTRREGRGRKVTAQEAVSILQSAIGYCQQAGIAVRACNWPDGMMLFIGNTHYITGAKRNGTAAEFRIGTPPPAPDDKPTAKRDDGREQDCPTCRGAGRVALPNGEDGDCVECGGTGDAARNGTPAGEKPEPPADVLPASTPAGAIAASQG